MKGRLPNPAWKVALRGGRATTHRPPRVGELKPPAKMPRCPKHLDREGKRYWRYVAKELMRVRAITSLDYSILDDHASAFSRRATLLQELTAVHTVPPAPTPEQPDPPAFTERIADYWREHRRWMKMRVETDKGLLARNIRTGEPILNPYLSLERQSRARLDTIEKQIKRELYQAEEVLDKTRRELGLSPVARVRLPSAPEEPANPEDEFLRMVK